MASVRLANTENALLRHNKE